MDDKMENRLKEAARAILMNARDGDWQHTLRAVSYGKYLLEHEEGDPEIVVPALFLHDIGWSRVDYSDFKEAHAYCRDGAPSVKLHMQYGAEMASRILGEMGYDGPVRDTVAAIIAVHDLDAVFAMNDPSAVLVAEADRLDRYGVASLKRYETLFGPACLTGSELEGAKASRREGLRTWFRTPTAIALARKLIVEMGWAA